jgi:hypothetical protein
MTSPLPPHLAETRAELHRDLLIFAGRACSPLKPLAPEESEPLFDALAGRVLAWQRAVVPAYDALAVALEADTSDWRTAPRVPTALFAELDLCSLPPSPQDRIFLSSGTTSRGERRGRRRVPDLRLYDAAMAGPFVRHVLRGLTEPVRWVSLIPHASVLPESSLSFMVTSLSEALARETFWGLDAGGLDLPGTSEALSEGPGLGTAPVVLLATAFALADLLERLPRRIRLPRGSRVMVTGGFKGKRKALAPPELFGLVTEKLGVPNEGLVEEYGMTELTSQAWGRPLEPNPTLRFTIVDPVTGATLEPGAEGLVACFDLLNLDNVSSILTSDLGILDPLGRLRLTGRLPGAAPRGCSLTAEAILGELGQTGGGREA